MVTATADPSLRSLQHIEHSGEYVRVPNVAVFDEHDEHRKDGKLVRRFDARELQRICDRTNARLKSGDLSPIGPGHTKDDADELSQPEPWGYARDFRLGRFGPAKKLGILADFYIRRDRYEKAKTFPRRSVELWVRDGFIDWIALLRRTPQRDLGLLTYAKDPRGADLPPYPLDPLYYDTAARVALAAHLSRSGKLRYSMEYAMPAPTRKTRTTTRDGRQLYCYDPSGRNLVRYEAEPEGESEREHEPPEHEPDPTTPEPGGRGEGEGGGEPMPPEHEGGEGHDQGPPGVPPEFHAHFMASCRHHGLHKYMKGGGAAHYAVAPAPAVPGPTNALPEAAAPPPPPEDAAHDRLRMQRGARDAQAIRYAKLEQEVRELKQREADAQRRAWEAEADRRVTVLEAQGKLVPEEDRADIVADFARCKSHDEMGRVQARYARILQDEPTRGYGPGGAIPVDGPGHEGVGPYGPPQRNGAGGSPERLTQAQEDAALRYMRTRHAEGRGCEWDEAVAHATGRNGQGNGSGQR